MTRAEPDSTKPAPGFVVDHTRVRVGTGPADFEAVKAYLQRWGCVVSTPGQLLEERTMSDASITSPGTFSSVGRPWTQARRPRLAQMVRSSLLDSQLWLLNSVLTHPLAFSVRLRAHVGPVVPQPAASGV